MTEKIEIQEDGRVLVTKSSPKTRGLVDPHDAYTLNILAPNISAADQQAVDDKWATIPVPIPEPDFPPPTNISFDNFEGRFTATEWDDATDYVYEVNTTTGKPKRRVLVQGLACAQARNSVDLTHGKTAAFLQLLVNGNVITAVRKTQILTP